MADDDVLLNRGRRFQLRNPIKAFRAYRVRKRKMLEDEMLSREEKTREDLERFLMQLQEQHSWVTLQLPRINYQRMVKYQIFNKLKTEKDKRQEMQRLESLKEDGIGFFKGNIINYKKWQNSAAKHHDFKDHENAVYSCKLSPCQRYVLSASEDRTARLWILKTSQCIKVFKGHTKVVTDCDFHRKFCDFSRDPCILTASGDGTLRLWNTVKNDDATLVTTIKAHQQGVFRCCFSPDGLTFVSSSEDRSIKLWCFPEGYLLYIYKAHCSPVTAVSFSPTGRYLISGSDYGERKILLWDAKMESLMVEPKQFPHIIFWTPEGLIKRILIKQMIPKPAFWLARSEYTLLTNDDMLDIWIGELDPDEVMPNESEDEDEEKEDDDDDINPASSLSNAAKDLIPGDVRQVAGVSIYAVVINSRGEQLQATEYNPGGNVYFTIQSQQQPLSELYMDVLVKDKRFDSFLDTTGLRIGEFKLDSPIPWKPEEVVENAAGNKTNYRHIPIGLLPSANNQAIVYRESLRLHAGEDRDTIGNTSFDVCWSCPEQADLGTAVVTVNFKIRSTNSADDRWQTLIYTLKESPIRIAKPKEKKIPGKSSEEDAEKGRLLNEGFDFDLADRHRVFFEYIRDKKWDSVASFIDKKCVMHSGPLGNKHRRQWRAMNELAEIFDPADWIILHTPFVHSAGQSRSAALCNTDFFYEEVGPGHHNHHIHNAAVPHFAPHQLDESSHISHANGHPHHIHPEPQHHQHGSDHHNHHDRTHHDDDLVSADKAHDNETSMTTTHIHPHGKDDRIIIVDDAKNDHSELKEKLEPKTTQEYLHVPHGEPNKLNLASHGLDHVEEGKGQNKNTASETKELINAKNLDDNDDEVSTKVRPTSQDLKLNKLIFLKAVDDKKFEKTVKKNIRAEADKIEKMRERKLSIAEEVRNHFLEIPYPILIQRLKTHCSNVPNWIKNSNGKDDDHLQKNSANQLGSWSKWKYSKLSEETNTIDEIVTPTQHSLVKLDRFGPEIEEFSMPIPVMYPLLAGQGRRALENELKEYDGVLHKQRVQQLPATLDEAFEPTLVEKMQATYHSAMGTRKRIARHELELSIQRDVRISTFAESVYESSRRPSQLSLEGLEPHYPNVFCQPEAILLPSMDFLREESLNKGGLLGKVTNAVSSKRSKDGKDDKVRVALPVGRKPTLEQARIFNELKNRTTAIIDEAGGDDTSNSKPILARKPLVKYPPEFYTGRRGICPTAPGLQAFATSLLHSPPLPDEIAAQSHDHTNTSTSQSLTTTSSKSLQKKAANKSIDPQKLMHLIDKISSFRGLIRRFDVRGFELAHHGSVNDAVFSPSETRVATAGGDGLVKIWDPRDGSYVQRLQGHSNEVFSVKYSSSEQFLVSAGADAEILVWSLLSLTVIRRLLGHSDVVYSIAMDGLCGVIVSASHDQLLKSWYTTPRYPEECAPPRIIAVSDTTAHVTWVAPPSFNLEIAAFHMQYRIGLREKWSPSLAAEEEDSPGRAAYKFNPNSESEGFSIAPQFRSMIVKDLIAATSYQFRIRAENRMGLGGWSQPSKIVKTEYGIPEAFERPILCGVGQRDMSFIWFAPNLKTFGSASQTYEIQCKGNGKSYEEHPTLAVPIDEARKAGMELLEGFRTVYARHMATKDMLVKSAAKALAGTFTMPIGLPDFENYLSLEKIKEVIDKVDAQERTIILVLVTFRGLRPGFMYLFRTRGVNVAGHGPWSPETYSTFTLPVVPHTPLAPRIKHSSLRSIEFFWEEPDDGGSAITAYQIHLKNTNKEIQVSRSETTFNWTELFPGKSYFLRVRAMNVCGWSEYSPWNDVSESYTITAPPDRPRNPLAVSGTWHSIDLEVTIPFNNGAVVTAMEIQQRFIEPFEIGDWQRVIRPEINNYSGIYNLDSKFFLKFYTFCCQKY